MSLNEVSGLRSAITQLGRTGRGRRYGRELRGRVVSYIQTSGCTIGEASQALGIPQATLKRWVPSAPKRLRPIVVAELQAVARELTLTTPSGHRLTGLDVTSAAELLGLLTS